MINNKVIIHVPHSSLSVPDFFLERLKVDRDYFNKMNIYESDYLIEHFIPDDCNSVIFNYSRMFCDVERFRDDNDEYMAKHFRRGVVYELDSNKKEFVDIDDDYKDFVKSRYYDYHHKELLDKTNEIMSKYAECIIVDLHSYSDSYVSKTSNNDINNINPDICIGFNDYDRNKHIINRIQLLCNKYSYTNSLNYPYSGSLVPLEYLNDDKVTSVMLEINKRIYLNNDLNELDDVKSNILKNFMRDIFNQLKGIKL